MVDTIQIPNLPAATSLDGTEQFEIVQGGVSRRATIAEIATYVRSFVINPTTILTGQVTVTTSATPIVASRAGRSSVVIINVTGTSSVFVGPSGVTTSNGQVIPGALGAGVSIDGSAAIFGIVSSGTQVVSYMEIY